MLNQNINEKDIKYNEDNIITLMDIENLNNIEEYAIDIGNNIIDEGKNFYQKNLISI